MSRPDVVHQTELEVAREITEAYLKASHPVEVYRLALARVLPLVRASFGSVFLRDPEQPELLKLAAAQNWPQASARYLGQLRIRVGRGPTGRAVAEAAAVEVADLFADLTLREWWEPARELGFASLISLPLTGAGDVPGALTFYFETPHDFTDEERALLRLIAQQLSATAERAHRMDALTRANEALRAELGLLRRRLGEAEDARRLKDEFLANVSHELRTPLTSILGYAYLLESGHTGALNEEQSATIAKIDRSASALERLISDLLELSRLKLGRTAVEPGPIEAVHLAELAVSRIGTPPEGVELRLVTPDGRSPLTSDADKVLKILENLLSNAVKFTSRGEVTLTVTQRRAGSAVPGDGSAEAGAATPQVRRHVEWAVRDTGIGIRPSELEAIFDEFRQVDGSSTRAYGGTGLGLALSLRLARLLHGEILVESEPGHGSTFVLRLPVEWDGTPAPVESSAGA